MRFKAVFMRFKRRSRLPLYNYTGEMRSLVIALEIRFFEVTGFYTQPAVSQGMFLL